MESLVIDDIDMRLLDLLQADASLSNQALAERAHLSPPTCLRRVKRLRQSGPMAARSKVSEWCLSPTSCLKSVNWQIGSVSCAMAASTACC